MALARQSYKTLLAVVPRLEPDGGPSGNVQPLAARGILAKRILTFS